MNLSINKEKKGRKEGRKKRKKKKIERKKEKETIRENEGLNSMKFYKYIFNSNDERKGMEARKGRKLYICFLF